jgi:uncharacterized protein (DUF736 family)
MPHIGSFIRTAEGFTGHLRTLTLDIEVTLVPADHADAENAPDYRIHLGADTDGPEIGAGWKRTGERAGDYVALLIDDPTLTQPLRANLFQSDVKGKAFALLWSRPAKRDDKR